MDEIEALMVAGTEVNKVTNPTTADQTAGNLSSANDVKQFMRRR